jgi:hypothetical protein
VLARRSVSALGAVQTAAAGAAGAVQSREQLAELVVADLQVRRGGVFAWPAQSRSSVVALVSNPVRPLPRAAHRRCPATALPATQADDDRPSDRDFGWAQDSYNVTARNLDTWAFFAVFRTRLWLLDQKWSYVGGFTGAWLPGGVGSSCWRVLRRAVRAAREGVTRRCVLVALPQAPSARRARAAWPGTCWSPSSTLDRRTSRCAWLFGQVLLGLCCRCAARHARLGPTRPHAHATNHTTNVHTRHTLQVGQLCSTRSDLFPAEVSSHCCACDSHRPRPMSISTQRLAQHCSPFTHTHACAPTHTQHPHTLCATHEQPVHRGAGQAAGPRSRLFR